MSTNDLRSKVDAIFTNSDILGSHIFHALEYKELVEITSHAIQMSINTGDSFYSERDHKVIFIMLVEAAKRWHLYETNADEGEIESGFWNFIISELDKSMIPEDSDQKIYDILRSIVNKISYKFGRATNKKVYYGTVLMHALAPKKSLQALFGLAYNVFKEDFDFEYSLDDEWFSKEIIQALRDRFSKSSEYGSRTSITVGPNIYSLNVGIKEMIMSAKLSSSFIVLFNEIMEAIHHLYHHEILKDSNNYYIKELISWWSDNQGHFSKDRKSRVQKDRVTSLNTFSPRYIKNVIANKVHIFLEIPSIRTTCQDKIIIKIFDGEEEIKTDSLMLIVRAMSITTKQILLNLDSLPLSGDDINLRVTLTTSKGLIYDSKTSLYRQIILFRDENEVNSSMNNVDNYFVYSRNFKIVSKCIKETNALSKYTYNILPVDGDFLRGQYRHYVFSDNSSTDGIKNIRLLGYLNNLNYIHGQQLSSVFNDKIKLVIPKSLNLNGLELIINQTKVIISDILSSVLYLKSDDYIEIDITSLITTEKVHKITVFSFEKNIDLLNEYITFFRGLKFTFSANLFFSQENKNAMIEYNQADYSIKKYITYNDEYLNFIYGEGYFQATIPWLYWNLTGRKKSNKPDLHLHWIEEIITPASLLEFECPLGITNIEVFVRYDNKTNMVSKSKHNKYLLGSLIFGLIINEHDYIDVFARVDGDLIELFTFTNKERMTGNPVLVENTLILWQPKNYFIGNPSTKFRLILKSNMVSDFGEIVKNTLDTDDQIFDVILEDGGYQIEVFKIDSNPFINKDRLIFSHNIYVGSPFKAKYYQKIFRITGVSYDQTKFVESPLFVWGQTNMTYYVGDLDYVDNKDEVPLFKGRLFYINNKNKRTYCDEMTDEKGILRKINPVMVRCISSDILTLIPKHSKGDNKDSNLLFNDLTRQLSFDDSGLGKIIRRYQYTED